MGKVYYYRQANRRQDRLKKTGRRTLTWLTGLLFLVLLSGLLLFGYHYVIHSPRLAAQLRIEGNVHLSAKEVLEQAGLSAGVNLLSVNASAVERRLAGHPWIDSIRVRYTLSRVLRIQVREHRPVAILDIGRRFILNDRGRIFKEWSPDDPEGLPVVKGLKFLDLDISGQTESIPFNAVMTVLQFGLSRNSVLPNHLIERIRVDRELGLTVEVLPDNSRIPVRQIQLGYTEYPEKIERLKRLLSYLKNYHGDLKIHTIDLSNLDRVVIRPIEIDLLSGNYKEV